MADISRIANVAIDLRTAAIREKSFDSIMVMGEHTLAANRTLIISGPDELVDLGLATDDPLYLAAQDAFSQTPSVDTIYIGRKDAAETWTDALIATNDEDSAWYGLITTSQVAEEILEIAAWAESNKKLHFPSSADAGVIDQAILTDVASQLKDGNYFRSAFWYHGNAATDYLNAAIMSKSFRKEPGNETYANQRLAAVQVDRLTETQANAALNKNANTFEPFRNLSITQGGKTAAGEWIDIIRFRDALEERVEVNVFGLFIDNRIPFIDDGINQVKSKMAEALDWGVEVGGLAPEEQDEDGNVIPSYTISSPRSSEVSFNDKANRTLKQVRFSARLAGAIHVTEIFGTLSYEI